MGISAQSLAQGTWFYGVFCTHCEAFLAIAATPAGATAHQVYAASGVIVATCRSCGNRAIYSHKAIQQRAEDRRQA